MAFAISLILIGITIATITELKNDMPEDKQLSSGYSVVRSNMEKIDNRANILNYTYVSKRNSSIGQTIYHLKDLLFSFWEEVDLAGVPKSFARRVGNEETLSLEQYPQGICMTEDYLLVTSYSEEKDALGECRVFDKFTGEHLVTLGMDKDSHLGGITYDGTNIWVCNSSRMMIERISYAFICHAAINNTGGFVDVTNLMEGYLVKNIPSSLFYYEGNLYVSTHRKWTSSKMISYRYDDKRDVLEAKDTYKIPAKVQGIALDERGRVYVSTSYGRKLSSYLKIYESMKMMHRDVDAYMEMIEMPPCSEGIAWDSHKLYILFESAGKKYLEGTDGNGKSIAPLDKILIIDRAST